MKKFSLLLLLLCPLLSLAQEKISFVDGREILQQAAEAGSEGEYLKSLELISRVHPKDSSYISSLVPKSYYLLNIGNNEEAAKVAEKGLTLNSGAMKLSFHINKTVAFLNREHFTEALAAVEEGLKVYPRSFQLWYNKGLILEKSDRIQEATAAYQQSVLLNPSNALPHLRLGNICYKQELTAQAMMAFNMYLLLNPDGKGAFQVLGEVNELVRTKNPHRAKPGLEISGDDASFEDLDLLLDNRLALNDQYKIDSKVDIAYTKQNHLLLSQLASYDGEAGFWAKIYVPLFNWVWNNGHFVQFTNVVSFSIENDDYKKIVRKDIEGLKTFRTALLTEWQNLLQPPNFRVFEEDKEVYFRYANLRLDGIGKADGETLHGAWKFFNADGLLAAEGFFDGEGKRTGLWKWYNDKEKVKETANYENGVLHGENKGFFDNGRLQYVAHYENDELNGEHLVYNRAGALIERKFFKDNELEGDYRSNFPVGEVLKEFDIFYKNGLVEGKAYEYYADGKIYSEMNFKAGEKNGIEKNYNRDGSLSSEIKYEANSAEGPYTTFYTNGKVNERSLYRNGLFEGTYESFYDDGTLKSVVPVKEGLYQGVAKYYDRDGKLHYEYDYKNGEIIGYRFFGKAGSLLASGKRKGGEFYYRSYAPYGEVTAEGLYDISGGRKGPWKFYTDNGSLIGEGIYAEDKANGLYTEYYETGEKLSEANYEMDKLQGYYRSFYSDGQMKGQGWYKDGEQHGEWQYYYPDGKLQIKNFFHKGDFHNLQEFYGVDGKLTSTLLYDFGQVLTETFYTPEEEVHEIARRNEVGEHSIKLHHFNGKISHEIDYVNGIKHGKFTQFDHSGKKIEEGQYINGEQSGTWTGYYLNGEKKRVNNFSRGDMHGEITGFYEDGTPEIKHNFEFGRYSGDSKFFHENGALSVLTPHASGEEHGRKEFFDPSGNLELVRFYEHGRFTAYSYLDENSEELPVIPLENESGIIQSFYDNGKPSREMEYLNGNVVGPYKSYYYSGILKYETFYQSGEYHGTVKEYYPDGNLQSEKNYHFGMLHGPSRSFFKNGKLKEEINYIFDLKHGKAVTYDEKGVKISQEQYFNGNVYEAEKI
ncbi:toxin-antitoxin system YwqK family antitoxin [Salinimicrobium xinjiangense]|uniref:toxin-antitoxin system YwqK family antitoxin n=1 Tax=Salinimicrobium xinjiangense TaxID=438596 RepID=UPI000429B981|nr:toxin-antitoxin system YwqK family antitoxin [Salinimicrobium xinjiangense]